GLGDERLELGTELHDLSSAALLRCEPHEVADELVGISRELGENCGLPSRLDLRVAEERAELGHVVHCRCQRGEVGRHGVDALRLLRRLEERAGVHALRDCHYADSPSRAEKSSSEIASSISRRWSSASSTFPVTRAVASSVRSATSERIMSSERLVSASIWRFVSSSRRVRSVSASSLTRSICASATLRASARMPAASPFASAISCRCCSRS